DDETQGLRGVGGELDVVAILEELPEHVLHDVVVVDDEDLLHGAGQGASGAPALWLRNALKFHGKSRNPEPRSVTFWRHRAGSRRQARPICHVGYNRWVSGPFERLLDDLNPAQREAVTAGDGPLLVLAGAGSGKTRVIAYRIAWLLAQGPMSPRNLLAVTFTNKAAAEMARRVEDLLLPVGLKSPLIATFHSACVRILRQSGT